MNYALSIEILRRFAPQNDIVGVGGFRRPDICRLISVICPLNCFLSVVKNLKVLNCNQTLRFAQGDKSNVILNEVKNLNYALRITNYEL